MQYTKKSEKPPVATQEDTDTVVHVLGQQAPKADAQGGAKTDTGPQGVDQFPGTDTWNGKPITGDYQTIPEDKEAIEENLRTAGAEVRTRFGLDTRGVPMTPPGEPNKPEEESEEPSGK